MGLHKHMHMQWMTVSSVLSQSQEILQSQGSPSNSVTPMVPVGLTSFTVAVLLQRRRKTSQNFPDIPFYRCLLHESTGKGKFSTTSDACEELLRLFEIHFYDEIDQNVHQQH